MPVRRIARPRVQQPRGLVPEIDWDHPLAPKTGFVALPLAATQLAILTRQGVQIIYAGLSVSRFIGRHGYEGYGLSSVSTNTASMTWPVAVGNAADGNTIVTLGVLNTRTTAHRIFEGSIDGGAANIFAVLHSVDVWQLTLPRSSSPMAYSIPGGPFEPYAVGWSHDGTATPTSVRGWVGGIEQPVSVAQAGAGSVVALQNQWKVAQRYNPIDRGWVGVIPFIYIDPHNRPEVAAGLSSNPWQIFKPRRLPVFVPEGMSPANQYTGVPSSSVAARSGVLRSAILDINGVPFS